MKEFDQTAPDSPWDLKTTVEEDVRELGDILEKTKLQSEEPSQKALDIAKSYLTDDTDERVNHILDASANLIA